MPECSALQNGLIPSRRSMLAIVAGSLIGTRFAVAANGYPERPVKIIVPYAPGGAANIAARRIATKLTELWGQTAYVENRPGAGGLIGADLVAKAQPDGLTLLYASDALITIIPALTTVAYDPLKDLVPIRRFNATPQVLIVNKERVPVTSFADFLTWLAAQRSRVSYGSSGAGTLGHLTGELFQSATGANLLHVPFRGGGQSITALLGGEIQFIFATISSAIEFIKADRVRALAITSDDRNRLLPDLPTVRELGYPQIATVIWGGIFAPAGVPGPILQKLQSDMATVSEDAQFRASVEASGAIFINEDTNAFRIFIENEHRRWGELGRTRQIKLDL